MPFLKYPFGQSGAMLIALFASARALQTQMNPSSVSSINHWMMPLRFGSIQKNHEKTFQAPLPSAFSKFSSINIRWQLQLVHYKTADLFHFLWPLFHFLWPLQLPLTSSNSPDLIHFPWPLQLPLTYSTSPAMFFSDLKTVPTVVVGLWALLRGQHWRALYKLTVIIMIIMMMLIQMAR